MMPQFDGRYDPFITCCLADEYQNGSKGDRTLLNELLLQTSPLVGVVAKLEIGPYSAGESRDPLCVAALEHIWTLYEGSSVPTESIRRFTSFLYTSIKRAMIDAIRECSQQVFDFGELCEEPPLGQLPTHAATEARMQLGQIKDIVRAIFDHDCRFVGREMCACKFMAMCMLGYVKQDPMAAQHRFKLTRARVKVLHQYTRIHVKANLYLLKSLA